MLKWIVYTQLMGRLLRCGVIWADNQDAAKEVARDLWGSYNGPLVVLQDDTLRQSNIQQVR